MGSEFEDLAPPTPAPACSPQEIFSGPTITPEERIKLYSDEQFEELIKDWAFFYLQQQVEKYVKVQRFGGSGDLGRDVVGYLDRKNSSCDVYQCKHYAHPIRPGDIWIELAKLCYHTFRGSIPVPRRYQIVAPQDVGPELARLLDNPEQLRAGLIAAWEKSGKGALASRITAGKKIELTGELRRHVENSDFSIASNKPIHEVIEQLRKTTRYAMRFGGGLTKPLPEAKKPPKAITAGETRYVEQLVEAYRDDTGDATIDHPLLESCSELKHYHRHFVRSRERYYCAETLREFAKDTLPEQFTFVQVQDQVLDGVLDIVDGEYESGYKRVLEVTKVAAGLHIGNHPLGSYVTVNSKQGICHQLANDDRLNWCT